MKKIWMVISVFFMITLVVGCRQFITSDNQNNTKGVAETLEVNLPSPDAYDAVLKLLKISGYTFDVASSREIGQIISNLFDVKDGFISSTAYKIEITFIGETDKKKTNVIITVSRWYRSKVKIMPWSKEDIDSSRTKSLNFIREKNNKILNNRESNC